MFIKTLINVYRFYTFIFVFNSQLKYGIHYVYVAFIRTITAITPSIIYRVYLFVFLRYNFLLDSFISCNKRGFLRYNIFIIYYTKLHLYNSCNTPDF
ncbi:hypothetical protein Hanom_Chr16g01415791 [Helianthus anomalus]